jgi:hypothetical protein
MNGILTSRWEAEEGGKGDSKANRRKLKEEEEGMGHNEQNGHKGGGELGKGGMGTAANKGEPKRDREKRMGQEMERGGNE